MEYMNKYAYEIGILKLMDAFISYKKWKRYDKTPKIDLKNKTQL